MHVEVCFGALAPKLKEQLKGRKISKADIDHLQRDADALVRVHIRRLISDSTADSARKKLMKKIMQAVKG